MMNVRKILEDVNATHQERLWTIEDEDDGILWNDWKRLHDDTEIQPRRPEVSNKNLAVN